MSKKYYLMILFIISCSIHTIAQTDFYYYKGNKIPLFVNKTKVCITIPKGSEKASERILANVNILDTIKDETFETFIITQSDFEKLSSMDSWRDDAKSVILTSSYYTKNNKEVFSSPYLNIQLHKEQDIDLLTLYAEKYKLRIVGNGPFSSLMPLWYSLAITQNSKKSPLECANELFESGDFAASVPDLCSKNLTYSNDPFFNQQWGLYNINNPGIDINVSSAWNLATGKNIKIAILDRGVELGHKDLSDNIDSISYDTETGTSQIIYGDHGTHCAGIAAAIKDNKTQIAGVAPEATIVSISNKEYSYQNAIKLADGITWACNHGVDVISCSLGTYEHPALESAISNALSEGRHGKGCVFVFAAGNEGNNYVSYPANCNDTILAVGAIDNTGDRASFSNYGTKLDLVAPGVHILSTILNDTINYKDGTSMACPHVAGVAALILQRNSELTVSQVNDIICSNAKRITSNNYNFEIKPYGTWNNEYGYGLVDAYKSVYFTPENVYIQNDTITGSRVISGEYIYIGKDVTNNKPYGNVVLGQGNITLQGRSVKIKNSTTVPLGTTLTIE